MSILEWLIDRQTMNPMDSLLEQLTVVLEKSSRGSNFDNEAAFGNRVGGGRDSGVTQNHSATSNDIFDARMKHHLESFDEKKNEYLLASKNICEDYRKVCEADFDYITKIVEDVQSGKISEKDADKLDEVVGPTDLDMNMVAIYQYLTNQDNPNALKKDDVRKQLIDSFYYRDGDANASPENIRKMLQLRSNYNKRIMKSLESMLRLNYSVLGISSQEADTLIQGLEKGNNKSVKTVKNLIEQNKSKFISSGKIDLRSIGYGVLFCTKQDLGPIGEEVNIDNFLQYLMRYDCIIVGHGDSVKHTDEQLDDLDKYEDTITNSRNQFYDRMIQKHSPTIRRYMEFRKQLIGMKIIKEDYIMERMQNIITDNGVDMNAIHRNMSLGDISIVLRGVDKDVIEKISKKGGYLAYQDYGELPKEFQERFLSSYKDDKTKIAKMVISSPRCYDPIINFRDHVLYYGNGNEDYYSIESLEKKSYSDWEKCFNICKDFVQFRETDWADAISSIKSFNRNESKTKKKGKAIYNNPKGTEYRWVIQPVSTDKGGPFRDVNDLLRQVIKEGHKNILIISCNPGSHSLDPDVANAKGIHVHHATYSLYGESTEPSIEYDQGVFESLQPIFETEQLLMDLAESYDIDYNDNHHLVATYESVMESEELWDDSVVMEGIGGKIWDTVVALAKKLIEALIALFKAVLNFIKNLILKIASIFTGKKDKGYDSFNRKQKVSFIALESAHVVEKDIATYEELEKFIKKSNDSIAKEVNRISTKQTKLAKDMEAFSEQQQKRYAKANV